MTVAIDTESPASPATSNPIWEAYETPRGDLPHLRCWAGDTYRSYTWDDWRDAAERSAAGLRQLGVGRGSRVAAVLTNRFEVCSAVIGTWLAGGTLLSMPVLRRGQSPDDYRAQLQRLCRSTRPDVMLVEERFGELLSGEDVGAPVASFESLATVGPFDPTPPADDAPAFVQYSSGSTSEPKGCVLTLSAIGAQELMLADRARTGPDSNCVSWLPLSHDMGLFGCVLHSWTTGMRLALGTPERFLRRPHTWMDDCAAFDATVTVSPNFGLALATRRARRRPPAGHFRLRTLVLGGERIESSTITEAAEVLAPYGVDEHSITPAYGLAEATLAVTMKRYGELPKTITVDAEAAYQGELVVPGRDASRRLVMVSCGPPVEGVSVRIEDGETLGRICVRSDALAREYLDAPDETGRCFVDGELVTEDVGFIRDGELYVLGRTDDAIPIGGRNVYARDVELALSDCPGARAGCATLVDVPDEQGTRLVVLAEPSGDAESVDVGAVADELAKLVYGAAGARPRECVLLRPGSLPKTPSGKIQRFRCRALVTGDAPEVVRRVIL